MLSVTEATKLRIHKYNTEYIKNTHTLDTIPDCITIPFECLMMRNGTIHSWYDLSDRDDLDIQFVIDNLQLPWIWEVISRNKNVTMEFVRANPHLPWNPSGLGLNPNLTIDDVLKGDLELDIKCVSVNTSIHPNDMFKHPEIEWSLYGLAMHKHLTLDMLCDHPELEIYPFYVLYKEPITERALQVLHKRIFNGVSCHPLNNLTSTLVQNNLYVNWDWNYLSCIREIARDLYHINKSKPWNLNCLAILGIIPMRESDIIIENIEQREWGNLSKDTGVELSTINQHPNWLWSWGVIEHRKDLTEEFIRENYGHFRVSSLILNKHVSIATLCNIFDNYTRGYIISYHPKTTIADIRKYQTDHLSWNYISENTSIPATDILDNLDLPWEPEGLLSNNILTTELFDELCIGKGIAYVYPKSDINRYIIVKNMLSVYIIPDLSALIISYMYTL